MTEEEALYKTKKKFTNLVGGDILPGVTVGEIISYYESLIAGNKPASTNDNSNIEKQFIEEDWAQRERDFYDELDLD